MSPVLHCSQAPDPRSSTCGCPSHSGGSTRGATPPRTGGSDPRSPGTCPIGRCSRSPDRLLPWGRFPSSCMSGSRSRRTLRDSCNSSPDSHRSGSSPTLPARSSGAEIPSQVPPDRRAHPQPRPRARHRAPNPVLRPFRRRHPPHDAGASLRPRPRPRRHSPNPVLRLSRGRCLANPASRPDRPPRSLRSHRRPRCPFLPPHAQALANEPAMPRTTARYRSFTRGSYDEGNPRESMIATASAPGPSARTCLVWRRSRVPYLMSAS
jgi:hypothetical protein